MGGGGNVVLSLLYLLIVNKRIVHKKNKINEVVGC